MNTTDRPQRNNTLMLWDGNRQIQEYTKDHIFTTLYNQNSFEPVARIVQLSAQNEKQRVADGVAHVRRYVPSGIITQEVLDNIEKAKIPLVKIYHYHCNHLGTPQELSDEKGDIVWLSYDRAWGESFDKFYKSQFIDNYEILAEQLQPFKFQGQFFDGETNLHYNRFRYYDSDVGMFVSRDPIGLMGGSNTYQYAPNPTKWIDPIGLKKSPNKCKCENNPCEGRNPAKEARSWQGKAPYTGKDTYTNVVVKKGTVLYTLYPHGPNTPNYFVEGSQLLAARGARAYNDSLQVAHSGNYANQRPMRTQVHAFLVKNDICMAKGKALANPHLGKGGGTQFFLEDRDKIHLSPTFRIIGL